MCKRPRDFLIKKCKLAFGQILHLSALFCRKFIKNAVSDTQDDDFLLKKAKKFARFKKKC